ncbi:Predicted dehydrogenase [Desulfonatronum thiosulfatophilum]|uniref:Predicted dehydrogenase n=1 Tax=Desulfonatronum thiosulfatophilum TaxID=617002 RepID=A0A1G6AHA1_9BACT|nr:Gfo/Idh/MocA family oxidoreductase [Desulfonatronum thiosulfatophilum]SDB07802.1 Predicted dehydrogenase [Desulfonatronum thiosulfatophilum]
MNESQPLKVGLIGVGKMGRNHLRVLSYMKPVQVVFIHDNNKDTELQLAAEYGTRAAGNLEEDLAGVDAVVLATPTSTHLEYIELISRYVSNIFVEKPLTDSLESTRAAARLAREKNLRIQVGFIERFNPVVTELVKIVGRSTEVVNMDLTRTDKVLDRNLDVDVVLDLMVHDLDLALYLRGPVEHVQAFGQARDGLTALAHAVLVHTNGSISRIMASKITEKRIRQISVTCPDLFVEADLLQKELVLHRKTVEQRYADVSLASVREAVFVRHEEALLAQLLAFVGYCRGSDCVAPAHVPDVGAALASMELAELIRESISHNASIPSSLNPIGF